MADKKFKTNCGIESTIKDLIGKKCKIANVERYEGEEWIISREGFFNGCVDIRKPNHVYLDIKVSDLILIAQ